MRIAFTRSMRMRVVIAGLMITLGLAACSTASPATLPLASGPSASPADSVSLTREDGQGAVTIEVTPLNLTNPAATLDFEVVLDTHSVDLSMDLAQSAVLRADTGAQVSARAWPIGSGHHYEGTLSFPIQTTEGVSVLAGARTLTLVIKNLDAPERIFEWDLSN